MEALEIEATFPISGQLAEVQNMVGGLVENHLPSLYAWTLEETSLCLKALLWCRFGEEADFFFIQVKVGRLTLKGSGLHKRQNRFLKREMH